MENSEPKKEPELSKRQNKWLNKRLGRYHAFIRKFDVTEQIPVAMSKRILVRMTDDREKHEAFSLHHKINNKGYLYQASEKRVIYFKGHRKEVF